MVQQVRIKRGGKEHTAPVGITEDSKTRLSIMDAELDPTHGQPVKRGPLRLIVDFDGSELNGEVIAIQTRWKQAMVSNAGKPIHATGEEQLMITNQADIKAFVQMFGGPILMSMLNGYVREKMGFNDKPVFNAQGQVIAYTQEQENEPPVFQGPGSYNYVPPVETEQDADTPNP